MNLLADQEFRALFTIFEFTAFRLQVRDRDRYDVRFEAEAFGCSWLTNSRSTTTAAKTSATSPVITRTAPEPRLLAVRSRKLVRMNIDDVDDHFTSTEIIDDPAEVVQHNY